jgi:hypothetical protein
MLHTQTVETTTLDLIRSLIADAELAAFNLVGGTALSLVMGHRKSIDIDLFTDQDFDVPILARHLQTAYQAEEIRALKNGIFCYISDIKVDLIAHQYPLLHPPITEDGIRMLSIEDISAMKLSVVMDNGTRLKDFADLYFLLEKIPLEKMTAAFIKKYPDVNVRMAHAALLYHHDIRTGDKIFFLDTAVSLKEMDKRFRQATANTALVFSPGKTNQLPLKKTRQIQNKQRKRPGL